MGSTESSVSAPPSYRLEPEFPCMIGVARLRILIFRQPLGYIIARPAKIMKTIPSKMHSGA